MKVEVKKYMQIGIARNQNIRVYEYEKVKDINTMQDITPIYEGKIEDAPNEIRESFYVKVELGDPTIYYI